MFPLDQIHHASTLLKAGELVAFPTETVYGLGANALDNLAVARIFAVKQRPHFNPLIVHCADIKTAQTYAQWNAQAEMLATTFWPGPLTLVLPRKADCTISELTSAGLETIALRIPSHPGALQLLRECGLPLAAPSANRSGRVSPTTAQHVRDELGSGIHCILDGGACSVGLESTVVDVSGEAPVLLRPGFITQDMLELALKKHVLSPESGKIIAPGMLASHYAPSLPVRLNARSVQSDEALLAFGGDIPPSAADVLNLSVRGDLVEAAANLFAHLRALDKPGYNCIAVMPIPEEGLGIAINDRLGRAAAQRS